MTRCILAAAILSLTACADGGGLPTGARNQPITERFVMEPPAPAWTERLDEMSNEGWVTSWTPAASDPKHSPARDTWWKTSYYRPPTVSALDLASELARKLSKGCVKPQLEGPRSGTEEGVDVAYFEVSCLDRQSLVKVIRGHEALYVAKREFAYVPSIAQLREARAFLVEDVYLCPIARGVGRCARRD